MGRLNTSAAERGSILDRANTQLRIIDAVTAALSASGIEHWLFGGWAVDFLHGQPTRCHRDVDFAVWVEDLPRVSSRLETLGFRPVAGAPEGQARFDKEGELLELTLIQRDPLGQVITPGRFSDWPWLEGSFGNDLGRIGEVEVPVLTPESQLDSKEGFAEHSGGRPLREKDRYDIERLRTILSRRRQQC